MTDLKKRARFFCFWKQLTWDSNHMIQFEPSAITVANSNDIIVVWQNTTLSFNFIIFDLLYSKNTRVCDCNHTTCFVRCASRCDRVPVRQVRVIGSARFVDFRPTCTHQPWEKVRKRRRDGFYKTDENLLLAIRILFSGAPCGEVM